MTKLRELRLRKLLSIRDLAVQANVAPNTVQFAERGMRIPHYRSMERIAAALGVKPLEIDEFCTAVEATIDRKPSSR